MKSPVAEAVDRGDLDEPVRLVDGLCSAREWSSVIELRDRCRHAARARAAAVAGRRVLEYRLALEAPPDFAGPVVTEQAGRFALGPLWEVVASTHDWASLSPHLPSGPARSLVAQERVLRGEDLTRDDSVDTDVLDVPLVLLPWEPSYPVATYRSSKAEFPSPPPEPLRRMTLGDAGPEVESEGVDALLAVGLPWQEQSNGAAAAVAVNGSAAEAIARWSTSRSTPSLSRARPPSPGWRGPERAAAPTVGGAAHPRSVCGVVGARRHRRTRLAAGSRERWSTRSYRLEWHRWESAGITHGWSACVAITDPQRGMSWALYAVDDHREDPPAS